MAYRSYLILLSSSPTVGTVCERRWMKYLPVQRAEVSFVLDVRFLYPAHRCASSFRRCLKKSTHLHNIASAQHGTLRGARGIRQSRTQHCGKWNPSRAMARQAWLPTTPSYIDASFALVRRWDRTLSRTGCDQGMHTFVFVEGTRPDRCRRIGVPCRLLRVSQGQRRESHA
jgi:hypothetical protein